MLNQFVKRLEDSSLLRNFAFYFTGRVEKPSRLNCFGQINFVLGRCRGFM